jgi:RNA polymerase sigma-70 factor (ECF subfamily)
MEQVTDSPAPLAPPLAAFPPAIAFGADARPGAAAPEERVPCTDEEFERLLADIVEPAYRLALRLAGNHHDAEDLVQDAALRAYRFRARFVRGTSFKAWFYRILLNCLYSRSRKRQADASVEELADAHELYLYVRSAEAGLMDGDSDPLDATIARMTTDQVAAALASLPDEFRTVCTLYFMDDLAYQEIAEVLGVPIGTVRSRLHRGRRMLQKRLWRLACDLGLVPARVEAEEAP